MPDYTIFTDASSQGWGAHMGDSKISGIWTRIDRKLHINCLELKTVTCALQHWAPLLQGHQVMIATDNSTVVSYINKQGGTHSTSLLRLTVELFLWLESQGIIVRARHIPGCMNVIADHQVRLRRKVIPSARMEALMRHYKAAGFSDEVSRLAAAPRRPSTNRMYDVRWCRFTRWAAGQGIDPLNPTAAQVASFLFDLFDIHCLSPRTIKGYRTCISSVLNRTGKSRVVLHRTISDMIASMELQRPRATPVLPQWDLGVVLEALSKPPFEPLREASFKHLTLKTVFLLAMASAGRRSDALRFDQNYIQFKPKGAGVTLYFSPEFMRKNQKPNQVNDPWYIPAIPTGKPEFGAPNCPVRALRYYHRYLTEHPELRKDRRRLFVPIKDNNAGKELSAPSISRWICTTIVDSHAAILDSKNLSGSVKAHEVRAVDTSLQLFNKADLHSVMKAGRWSSGGTFTSFYLRDLCPQAESLQRAGPIVAAGDIVKISTF